MSDHCNGCGQPGLRFVTHVCPPPELVHVSRLCGCQSECGDDGDIDGPGTCKGLPAPPREPLVKLVLIDRRTGEVIG